MCMAGLAMHCRSRRVMGIVARDGCFADYVVAPEHNLHEIPDHVSDEEAVFVEPLAAAYQVPAQCRVDARSRVTVVGSGRLGILVAQVLAEQGARVTVIGRNKAKLEICEKLGIQGIHLDDLVPRHDHDVVVECTGSPAGLPLALELVRPRGTIVLKSTHAGAAEVDLAPLVVNEVNLVGSRCGPFGQAVNALARKAVRVAPLISRTFPIEQAEKALAAAAHPDQLKVLLAINPRTEARASPSRRL
jgi:threonine dehydrogenase-like Zn-dependent dehydrogenase